MPTVVEDIASRSRDRRMETARHLNRPNSRRSTTNDVTNDSWSTSFFSFKRRWEGEIFCAVRFGRRCSAARNTDPVGDFFSGENPRRGP